MCANVSAVLPMNCTPCVGKYSPKSLNGSSKYPLLTRGSWLISLNTVPVPGSTWWFIFLLYFLLFSVIGLPIFLRFILLIHSLVILKLILAYIIIAFFVACTCLVAPTVHQFQQCLRTECQPRRWSESRSQVGPARTDSSAQSNLSRRVGNIWNETPSLPL